MADEEIGARLKLKGRREFSEDANKAARDVKDIGDEAARADRKMRTMGTGGSSMLSSGLRGLTSVAKYGVVALTAMTGAVVAFGIQGYNSLKRIETIGAQTDAVLTSTGHAANVTREQIDNLAGSLEGVTGVEAESITEGQNLLLTFTNIKNAAGAGNDIFDRSTKAMVDLATAMGTTSAGSAIQLGKALNDPIKGVSALTRVGVSFTQQQKDQIEALQKSGDIMGAQKIILGELEKEFGGSAEAFGNTTAGLTARTKHLFGTLQESLVSAFMPDVNRALQTVHDTLESFVATTDEWLPPITEKIGDLLKTMWEVGGNFFEAFKDDGIRGIVGELDDLLGTGDLLSGTFDILGAIFESLGTIWRDLVLPVLEQFNEILPPWTSGLGLVAAVLGFIADNAEVMQPILAALLGGFIAFKVVSGIFNLISGSITLMNTVMAMNPIGLVVVAIAALAAGLIYAWNNSETFRKVVTLGFEKVKKVVMGVWDWVKNNWPLLLAILTGPIGLAVLAIVKNWDSIKEGVTGVKDWIVSTWESIVAFILGLPDRITSAASGLFDGIKDAFKSALNWIIRAWNGLDFAIPGFDPPGPGPKFSGFTLGVPDIPELHTGGTTTTAGTVNIRPDEELIFLPPSASVVPMSDNVNSMAAAFSGSSGRQEPIVVQVVLDRKVVAEAVYDYTGDRVARR